jgi:hypothetical protein
VSSTRLLMPSLVKLCRRWLSTVCGERCSREATCRLVRPSATSLATRSSHSVSPSQAPSAFRTSLGLRGLPQRCSSLPTRALSWPAPIAQYWSAASSSSSSARVRWPKAFSASAASSSAPARASARGLDP